MIAYTYNNTINEKVRLTNTKDGLDITPLNQIFFFDEKAPFNIMNFVKTPMGMMVCFTLLMLYCLNVMPDPSKN